MPTPNWEDTFQDGQTFAPKVIDRLKQLGSGGGGGSVNSVSAGDSTITVGGTATDPTVAVNAIAESQVTNLTTDLAAKQPLDSDLTAIAALDASTSGAIASDGAGWVKKTYAQFKTALSLTTADVPDSTDKRYVTDAQRTVVGNTSGTNTGDQTTVSGNAGTATALQTGRTIDGQTFDGTANITVIAPGTHAATSKATPVDADELSLVDSAASNVLKKLTWANLKATIKTYTDTLYPSGSGTSTGTNTGDQTISDATITTTDITTNNVSTSKHGFAPKAPNDATKFLDGTGAYSVPSGGSADRLGLTPTAVKTTGYTAAVGDLVPCDTTSAAFTVTLPTAPTDGSVIDVKLVKQANGAAVTVNTGGSDVFNVASGVTTLSLLYNGQSVLLQYKSSGAIWYVVARDDAGLKTALGVGTYGDGSDGSVTFDGSTTILGMAPSSSVYTLTRDFYFSAVTINSGVQLKTNGFRIFCSGTITGVDATSLIQWNGAAAAAGAAGAGISNANASIQAGTGAFAPGTAGAAGGTGAGANGTASSTKNFGGQGGTGGTAGANGGGTGGTTGAIASTQHGPRNLPESLILNVINAPAGSAPSWGSGYGGGTGGGAGGGDGSATSGAGGGGGGIVAVYSRLFAGTGGIQAKGGAGGTPGAGNRGGGGGGGGGFAVVVSQSVVSGVIPGWTVSVAGGTKGSPTGTGTNNATDGSTGTSILLAC